MDFNNLDYNKYQISFNKTQYNHLSIYKKDKLKAVITFHFLGMIDTTDNFYYWSNIIPGVNLNFTKENNKIKSLRNKFEDFEGKNQIYYQILSEDLIKIDDNINPIYLKNFFNKLLNKSIILLNSSKNKYYLLVVKKVNESY